MSTDKKLLIILVSQDECPYRKTGKLIRILSFEANAPPNPSMMMIKNNNTQKSTT